MRQEIPDIKKFVLASGKTPQQGDLAVSALEQLMLTGLSSKEIGILVALAALEAEDGHQKNAAERIGVTAPTLAARIKEAETFIGETPGR